MSAEPAPHWPLTLGAGPLQEMAKCGHLPRAWTRLATEDNVFPPPCRQRGSSQPADGTSLAPRPLANTNARARGIPGAAPASPSWALSVRPSTQRAAENEGGLPGVQGGQAAALEPAEAASSPQGTADHQGAERPPRPCPLGACRPTRQPLPHGHPSPSGKQQHGVRAATAGDRPGPTHSRSWASMHWGRCWRRSLGWRKEHRPGTSQTNRSTN